MAMPDLAGSPARSTRVFRFVSGSLTRRIEAGGQSKHLYCETSKYSQDRPLCFEMAFGGGIAEAFNRELLCDSEISHRPFPGEGILLGGRICDFFRN